MIKKFNRNSWKSIQEELNSSDFHLAVRDLLLDKSFSGMKVWQEVPLADIIESDIDRSLFFDFFIESLSIVIEVNGAHHYKPTQYGGMSALQARMNYKSQRVRDSWKKELLHQNGFHLIEIPAQDKKKLNLKYLIDKMTDVLND